MRGMIEFREEAKNHRVPPAVMQSAPFPAHDETSAPPPVGGGGGGGGSGNHNRLDGKGEEENMYLYIYIYIYIFKLSHWHEQPNCDNGAK
ncbi:hypothetical protein NHX12_001508 [Muraenolepis orangiensis]|uniref:Uncharacterized protein n=1 Tax=Muraenolepis orangiensis TaxID=630683 RepID=A0A9Q0E2L8_9TELE|nr:hypothetical protein NHX12_001508 [Muraenolepis orangiensis]